MEPLQRWFRATPPARSHASVFAVGPRVYMACAGNRPVHVALTDHAGANVVTRWRPRGSDGTRYRVRSTCDGLEGWLAVDNLRTTLCAGAVPFKPPRRATGSAPLGATESGDSGRRFGQRAD